MVDVPPVELKCGPLKSAVESYLKNPSVKAIVIGVTTVEAGEPVTRVVCAGSPGELEALVYTVQSRMEIDVFGESEAEFDDEIDE